MSARDALNAYVVHESDEDQAEFERRLDAFAAEVVAERDAQIIAWLGKKAREYKGNRAESASDVLARMASKISRGAVRPTPTGGQAPAPYDHGTGGSPCADCGHDWFLHRHWDGTCRVCSCERYGRPVPAPQPGAGS